jgi:hypothetical protein
MRSNWRRAVPIVAVSIALGTSACAGSETEVTTQTLDATDATGTTGAGTTGTTGAMGATDGTEPQPLPTPITSNVLHGERYFGVYLVAAPFDTPEIAAAVEQLAGYGIEAFPGSIGCDQGASEQLGVSSDLAAVAIYFERRSDAHAWADALDPPPLGVATVRTYCAD